MTAREKARAGKLRRLPAAAFDAEARRRGYAKMTVGTIPVPLKVIERLSGELNARAQAAIHSSENAPLDLNTVRAMANVAGWLKTYRDIHHEELRSYGLLPPEKPEATE